PVHLAAQPPDLCEDRGVLLMRPVREVQPEHIDPGLDQLAQACGAPRRGADRRDDLRADRQVVGGHLLAPPLEVGPPVVESGPDHSGAGEVAERLVCFAHCAAGPSSRTTRTSSCGTSRMTYHDTLASWTSPSSIPALP